MAVVERNTQEVWRLRAACRGPHAATFFPPPQFEGKREKLERERRAKEICVECRVREQCLAHALATPEPHGIWGGKNENERKGLLVRAE